MKNKYYIIIFVVLFNLYYLQGVLYPSGSFLSQFILIIYFFISISLSFRVFSKFKNKPILFLNSFIFINILYFIIGIAFFDINYNDSIKYLKLTLMALLPFYPFYYFGNNFHSSNSIKIFISLFFFVSILNYNRFETIIREEITIDNVVNNISYNFVLIIPFLLFFKKKYIQFIFILLIFYFVIISAKRGALICLIGSLLILTIYYLISMKSSLKTKLFFIIFTLITSVSLYFYIINSNAFIVSRLTNISEKTSGRNEIIEKAISYFTNDLTIKTFIFGYGYLGSYSILGSNAHNDYIETMLNFGIIGFILYFSFIISVYKWTKFSYISLQSKFIIYISISIWLLKAITTGVFAAENTALLSIVIGYCIGSEEKNKKINENIIYN